MVSKKITAMILSTMLLASTAAMRPVKAETLSLDTIYANAYTATVTAMQAKTQLSINAAREAIGQLPVNLDWAIGEFSKQVDMIQQPIFVKAYDAIVIAQNTPTQANINAAKAAIDPDMPSYYKGSYSSAVDAIQQQIMQEAIDAYNKAVQSSLQSDIDAANTIFDDIKTSTNPLIVQWVDLVQGLSDVSNLSDSGNHTNNYVINSATGTFGPEDSNNPTNITGNILINNTSGSSITLQNLNITGKISVIFGEGSVILDNVKVNGVVVTNVGSNSLHITGNSVVDNIIIQDTNNDAHIVIEGNANVTNADVLSGGKLEVASNAVISKVNISTAKPEDLVQLSGNFANVDVTKPSTVEAESGIINISSSTNAVTNVTANASATVNVGQGPDNIIVSTLPAINSSLVSQTTTGAEESFGVTTVANSFANKMVKVRISINPAQVSNVTLKYYETQGTNAGQYLPLTFDETGVAMYGPSTGFPLGDLTSQFKVTFNAAGSYTYKLEVLDLDGNVLTSTNPTVNVN